MNGFSGLDILQWQPVSIYICCDGGVFYGRHSRFNSLGLGSNESSSAVHSASIELGA